MPGGLSVYTIDGHDIFIGELQDSKALSVDRTASKSDIKLVAFGSDNDNIIYQACVKFLPRYYYRLRLQSINPVPQGNGVWLVAATYQTVAIEVALANVPAESAPPPPQAPGANDSLDNSYAFTIGETTRHITQSLKTISRTGLGFAAPPVYGGAIGVTKDKVEGVDVGVGTLVFTVTRTSPDITLSYVRKLRTLVGCTNNAAWYGFDKGAVKYKGTSFTPKPGNDAASAAGMTEYQGVFTFEVGQNQTNVTVVPPNTVPGASIGLIVPAVGAWEYLWVAYESAVDSGRTVERPFAAYVEQVRPAVDFALLGIGV